MIKLHVIVEKRHNFVVNLTKHIQDIEAEDCFQDLEDDAIYDNETYSYYMDVDTPEGIVPYSYIYTPEKGFIQLFTKFDLMMMKREELNNVLEAQLVNYEAQKLYGQFKAESSSLYQNLKELTEKDVVNEDSILLLQQIVINLYETLLEQQTMLTSLTAEGDKNA